MYFIGDKNAAVRQIEKYLYKIGEMDGDIPHVSIDGDYNDIARDAVRILQRKNGYEETGAVDNATFMLIKRLAGEYESRIRVEAQTHATEIYPLTLFDKGPAVLRLNALISELSLYYDLTQVRAGDLFDHATLAAVGELKKIFCLEENGAADAAFVARLEDELISREKFG